MKSLTDYIEKKEKREQALKMSRKIRRFPCNPRFLFDVYQNGKKLITVEGIPEDAIYLGVILDAPTGMWNFYAAHETFDVIPEGQLIPEMRVVLNVESVPV